MARYSVRLTIETDNPVSLKGIRDMIEVDKTVKGPILAGEKKGAEVTKVIVEQVRPG